ncbi:MAG: AAA family ATPase [Candidatus Thorarchaeota archaeon]
MECIILTGLQASGKSAFYVQKFVHTHVRINLDMLRTRNRERQLIQACLGTKTKFVVDNTNVTKESRAKYIELAKSANFAVHGYYLDVPLQRCLELNGSRGSSVPPVAIVSAYKKLHVPTKEEGFDQLFFVTNSEEGFIIEELS